VRWAPSPQGFDGGGLHCSFSNQRVNKSLQACSITAIRFQAVAPCPRVGDFSRGPIEIATRENQRDLTGLDQIIARATRICSDRQRAIE